MDELTWMHWVLGALGAIFVGLGKGGLPGMGNITVALYLLILPDPKLSVGVLLPILSAADIFAVRIYRRHASWEHLKKLFPWAILGLIIGYFSFQKLNSQQVKILIGGMLILFTIVHLVRTFVYRFDESNVPDNVFFRGFVGVMGGFATMIANAAGPIAAFYFLAMRLPKYAFIGTTAWFFLVINIIKVPFMIDLGIINGTWLPFSLAMMPFAIASTFVAPKIVKHINQKWFEGLIWFFIVVAGVKLLMP